MVAPKVLDGSTNGSLIQDFVAQQRGPDFQSGAIVVMDTIGGYGGAGIRAAIEAAGASLPYLSPYNPVENAFAKLKAVLKPTNERSLDGLWAAVGRVIG